MTRDASAWRDEIALREASLADARREAAAGELAPEALAVIEAREGAALVRARAALLAFAEAPADAAAPRRRRRSLLLVAFACFLLALVALLVATLVVRQPGTSPTGGVTLSTPQRVAQLLAEAQADTASGNDAAALDAYARVLGLDPANATALVQTGWLDFSAGSAAKSASVVAAGVHDLARAVSLYPSDPAARLYYAIAADSTPGEASLAIAQFRVFLSLHPTRAQLAVAAPFLARLGLG